MVICCSNKSKSVVRSCLSAVGLFFAFLPPFDFAFALGFGHVVDKAFEECVSGLFFDVLDRYGVFPEFVVAHFFVGKQEADAFLRVVVVDDLVKLARGVEVTDSLVSFSVDGACDDIEFAFAVGPFSDASLKMAPGMAVESGVLQDDIAHRKGLLVAFATKIDRCAWDEMPFVISRVLKFFGHDAVFEWNFDVGIKAIGTRVIDADRLAGNDVRSPQCRLSFVAIPDAKADAVEYLIRLARLSRLSVIAKAKNPGVGAVSVRPEIPRHQKLCGNPCQP